MRAFDASLCRIPDPGPRIPAVTVAITLLLLGSCAVPGTVRAQEPPIPLTLEEAIASGLANSLRLAELGYRLEAAEAAEAGRGASRLPEVALLGGYTRTNHVDPFAIVQLGQLRVLYPDAPDNYSTRVDLRWPIYTAGRLDALERAAEAERSAVGRDLEAARADLRLEITRAFWALVTAREAEQVTARALASIDAHVRDLRTRLDQGLIPPNDLLSAEAQQSRERLLALEATNTRGIAEADLRRLLGTEGPGTIEPRAALAAPTAFPSEAAMLVARALEQRPERKALEDRVRGALARVDAAAAGARPQVGVNAGFDYARPNPRIFPRAEEWQDSWDVSVSVSWPFWDFGRVRADRAEAAALAAAARSRVSDFDRNVAFEVRQRTLELDSSRAAIPVADEGVRAAAEARRVLGERFDAGVATSTEVLDAQTAVLQAELARTRALANARLAEARLARAIGQ